MRDQLSLAEAKRNQETIVIGISKYEDKITELTAELRTITVRHSKLQIYRSTQHYNLPQEKFYFYIQRLYSQGLLIDSGIGRIGMDPLHMMSITQFGIEFIKFIKDVK